MSTASDMEGKETNNEVVVAMPTSASPLPPLLRLSDELLLMIFKLVMMQMGLVDVRYKSGQWRLKCSHEVRMSYQLQLVCVRLHLLLSRTHDLSFFAKNMFVFGFARQFTDYRRYLKAPRNLFFENITLSLSVDKSSAGNKSKYNKLWRSCNECRLKHLNISVRRSWFEAEFHEGTLFQQWLDHLIANEELLKLTNLESFTLSAISSPFDDVEYQVAAVREPIQKAERFLQTHFKVTRGEEKTVDYDRSLAEWRTI